jgi:hypothetical protein
LFLTYIPDPHKVNMRIRNTDFFYYTPVLVPVLYRRLVQQQRLVNPPIQYLYYVLLPRYGAASSLALSVSAYGWCSSCRSIALLTHHSHGSVLTWRGPTAPSPSRYRGVKSQKDKSVTSLQLTTFFIISVLKWSS